MVLGAGRMPDFSDRRTALWALAAGCAIFAVGAAAAVGTGNSSTLALLTALGVAPLLVVAAARWPYVFPFGLFCMLAPFDQAMSIPGAGSLPRYLGVLTALAVGIYAARKRQIYRPPLALYLWALFLAWVLIEMFRSIDMNNATATLQAMASLIVLYAVFATAPITERQLRFACSAIVAGGIVAAVYGMMLFHQHPDLLAKTDGRVTVNLLGRSLDANMFADALLTPFAIALIALLHARRPRTVLISFASLAVVFSAIVTSLSREALLAAAVIVMVAIWFSRRRLLGIVLAVPAFAALLVLVPSILTRIEDGFKTGGAGRTSIWQVDWTAFWQHPLIGWGTGNSIEAYDRNFLAVYQLYNAGWSRPPHNTALFIGVEFGIVGVVLFAVAFFAAFRPLVQIQRGDSLYDLRVAITASLISMVVASLFIDVSATKSLWLALILAAQCRTVLLSRRPAAPAAYVYEPPAAPQPAPQPAPTRPRTVLGGSMR